MQRLRHRADFLAAATAIKAPAAGFVLQSRNRGDGGSIRVGFTVSRKVGNSVVRNRARRRLREVVRLADPAWMAAGHDYVIVGRAGALTLPFARIREDFRTALQRVQARGSAANRPPEAARVATRGDGETGTQ